MSGANLDYNWGDGSPIETAREPFHVYAAGTFNVSIGGTRLSSILTIEIPNSNFTELTLSEMRVLNRIDAPGNDLSSVNFAENPGLLIVDFSDNSFSSIDFFNNRLLSEVVLNGNTIVAPSFPNNKEIVKLHMQNNGLTSISVVELPKMKDLDISQNATLTATQVGQILAELDDAGLHSGTVNYVGNSEPGIEFLSVYNSLQSKNWNILGPIPSEGSFLAINVADDVLLINASGDKLSIG